MNLRRRWRKWSATGALAMTTAAAAWAQRIEIVWPTPNRAYLDQKPLEAFVQPTVSGEATSALFGCVRSSGTQFHEGLDLAPTRRDRAGEAQDEIYAVLPGVVRHVSRVAGHSSYGRYIVLEHPEAVPAIYTLYAHLASIAPGLEVGARVEQAQTIAVMGRSAGGYTIPKERAHLHFEMGVRLTDSFQPWYDWRKFGSRNEHGVWNGMNLHGFDPLDFYNQFRERRVDNLNDYFRRQEPALRIRIASPRVPDFVTRYPSLLTGMLPPERVAGWEVQFNAFGLPFAWSPLTDADMEGYRPDEVRVIEADEGRLAACRCKDWVVRRRGGHGPGPDLQTLLQLLFGVRS